MSDELEFTLIRLTDDSRPVRSTNLAALSDLPRAQTEQFVETWQVLDAERRFELMRALVEQAEANIHYNFSTVFREALRDADARVRKLAIEGLWEDNRTSLIGPLIRLLTDDSVPEVRSAAASALGRFALMGELGEISAQYAREIGSALEAAWLRPGEPIEVRRRALESLAYLTLPQLRDFIANAYFHENELMRQSAVFAMGRSADRRWAKAVLEELRSGGPPMRFEAASAAGELGLTDAVKLLINLLDDPDGNVREAAAISLGQIGGPEARRALQEVVASDDERLAEAADEALQEMTFNSEGPQDLLFEFEGGAVRKSGRSPQDDDDEDDDDEAFDENDPYDHRDEADGDEWDDDDDDGWLADDDDSDDEDEDEDEWN